MSFDKVFSYLLGALPVAEVTTLMVGHNTSVVIVVDTN